MTALVRRTGAGASGFSLVELMTVLALISIIAVAAAPTFIALLRDQRVNRAAMRIVDVYRGARAMAIGRGIPIMLDWNKTGTFSNTQPGGTGSIEVLEPHVTTLVIRNCAETEWTKIAAPGTDFGVAVATKIDFKSGLFEYADVVFRDDIGTGIAATRAQICFAPNGRSYIRNSAAGAFRPITGIPRFKVMNVATPTAVDRTVFIPPNGAARIERITLP